jgi:hypothetical protein
MENLPVWIHLLFFIAFIATMGLFFQANTKPRKIVGVFLLLCVLQSLVVFSGFYLNTEALPPRFVFVVAPSIILIVYGLFPKQRQWIMKVRRIEWSTLLHIVRIPVEFVLYGLAVHELVPTLMTFEGRNFDILAGITAPIMAFWYHKKLIGKSVLLIWNYVGLILIMFIFVNAALSIESPIQQFAFDQPNRAVQYFPFILLPVAIAPIVVWTHISDIIYLKKSVKTKERAFTS